MTNVIQCKELIVDYKHKRALDGLTLSVKKGEIFGFLGPNGAGKSTTIKTLLGLLFASSGEVLLHGFSPSDPKARRLVGYLPEEANYYRFLTPMEILEFYGSVCGVSSKLIKARSAELLKMVGLDHVKNKFVGTFSKGMTQKISLAQCLIHDPETLILDEPTSGLDPVARIELRQLLKTLKEKGKTIFFSSHELSEVETVCDSVAVLKGGRVVKSGSMSQMIGASHQHLEKLFIEIVKGES